MNVRIKEARELAGLSQRRLAELISVNNSLIALMETGKRNPTPRTLRDIANVCGVRLEWLRDGELPMRPEESDSDDSASILDELAREYHLSDLDRIVVEAFLSLPEQYREGVVRYAEMIAERIREEDERKGEALKQSYILEQREKRSSASSTGSGDMDERFEA